VIDMNPIPFTPFIPAPDVLPRGSSGPRELGRTDLSQLCKVAEVAMRVTGGEQRTVVIHRGTGHFRAPNTYYVGIGGPWKPRNGVQALRILEVLAHSFHDYATRECVCRKGLFTVPSRRGRPALAGRAMDARERMRKMRAA